MSNRRQTEENMVLSEHVSYDYLTYAGEGKEPERKSALRDVNLQAKRGDFIAVLGHNGSGKSTFARHLNALLIPTDGTVWIDGRNTADQEKLWEIRQTAGMVFQNPDHQIVASVVEDDVAFGPENLGVPTPQILSRVTECLQRVGMLGFRKHSPHKLSGGQKQRVAIAGILAMHCQCIVLDEPTAMLDPRGRREVLEAIHTLNRQEGITVILITHYMEEAVGADHIFVMDHGQVALSGRPEEIFRREDQLRKLQLDLPPAARLASLLRMSGLELSEGAFRPEAIADAVMDCRKRKCSGKRIDKAPGQEAKGQVPLPVSEDSGSGSQKQEGAGNLLELHHLSYSYERNKELQQLALKDIDLQIPAGQFIGIIGETGSGKSTLIQQMNGLLKPLQGQVIYRGKNVWSGDYDRRNLRFHVGLVFQYPEYQLFENDVLTDVCFGPKNRGLSAEKCREAAVRALELCGIGEEYFDKSPFELSGGEKRRVAIAGVLAMEPEILILDEPTAGLDPRGRDQLLELLAKLCRERGMTICLVSHSMDDVARYADRLIVMDQGSVRFDDSPRRVFSHAEELADLGLSLPQACCILEELRQRGLAVDPAAMTLEEAADRILIALETDQSSCDSR